LTALHPEQEAGSRRPCLLYRGRADQAFAGIMPIIIMPPQFIIVGMPLPIMVIMF
jgi:hypothetical protein